MTVLLGKVRFGLVIGLAIILLLVASVSFGGPLVFAGSIDTVGALSGTSLSQSGSSAIEEQCSNGTVVPSPANKPGLVGDCEALLAAHAAMGGPGSLDWGDDRAIADWDGVVVAGNPPRVIYLYLEDKRLSGSIPPELGNLSGLRDLRLSSNRLTGSIPAELGNLSGLRDLFLDYNRLTGEIPQELTNLIELQHLYLRGNRLTGSVPAGLGNLTDLRELHLHDNNLTGRIPVELGNLTKLEGLFLEANGLTGDIPVELGNLTELKDLRLHDNNLTGSIPVEFGKLTRLEVLYLNANGLTGNIPTELGNLTDLVALDLYGNDLSGGIPVELGALNAILTLDLSDNQLTGDIPAELGNLNELTDLNLNDNQLRGEIPRELGSMGNIEVLNLSANQLTGSIPAELGGLAGMQDLYLHQNQLTGSIPEELGNLANVEDLWLESNQLTGSIPAELGDMSKLERLTLRYNRLTGSIPAALSKPADLEYLRLYGNNLSGCIPLVLQDIPGSDLDNLGLAYCEDSTPSSDPPEIGNKPGDGSIEKAENTGGVVYRFTATDAGDTVTWSLEGADKDAFAISNEAGTAGELTAAIGTTLDHEARSSYTFTVKASDGTGADSVAVTLNVTDVAEPPPAPAAPTVSAASTTGLTVEWTVPDTTGKPAIDDYDVQYREANAAPEPPWTAFEHAGVATSATITGLDEGTAYEAQVRARNAEGESPWSDSGAGSTDTSEPPASTPGGYVLGPSSSPVSINAKWPDGEVISVTLRVVEDLPSYVPDSVDPGAGASYQANPWRSNPRTITFSHPDHEDDIVVRWSYDPDYDDANPATPTVSYALKPDSPNEEVSLQWLDGEAISVRLRVVQDLPSYVPDSLKPGGASYRIDAWGSNPRTMTFVHPDHGEAIMVRWSVTQ